MTTYGPGLRSSLAHDSPGPHYTATFKKPTCCVCFSLHRVVGVQGVLLPSPDTDRFFVTRRLTALDLRLRRNTRDSLRILSKCHWMSGSLWSYSHYLLSPPTLFSAMLVAPFPDSVGHTNCSPYFGQPWLAVATAAATFLGVATSCSYCVKTAAERLCVLCSVLLSLSLLTPVFPERDCTASYHVRALSVLTPPLVPYDWTLTACARACSVSELRLSRAPGHRCTAVQWRHYMHQDQEQSALPLSH